MLFRMLEAGALPFETMLTLPQLLRGEPLAVALTPQHAQPALSCSPRAAEPQSPGHRLNQQGHSRPAQSQPAASVRAPAACTPPRRPSYGTETRVASLKKEALPGWPLHHGPQADDLSDLNEELSRCGMRRTRLGGRRHLVALLLLGLARACMCFVRVRTCLDVCGGELGGAHARMRCLFACILHPLPTRARRHAMVHVAWGHGEGDVCLHTCH